jgi:hypothetical protein
MFPFMMHTAGITPAEPRSPFDMLSVTGFFSKNRSR